MYQNACKATSRCRVSTGMFRMLKLLRPWILDRRRMSDDLLPTLPILLRVEAFRIREEVFRLLEEVVRFLSLVLPVEEVVLLPSTGVLTRFLMEYLPDLEKLALTFLVKEMANPMLKKPKIVIPAMVIHP